MKTLTIRGVPDDVHERFKERARLNRRSLNQELIAELIQVSGRIKRKHNQLVDELLAEADVVYAGVRRTLTASEIRKVVDDGRD